MNTVGPEDSFIGNLERIISEDRSSLLRAWRTTEVQRGGQRGEGEKRCRAERTGGRPTLAPVLQDICLFRSVSLISLEFLKTTIMPYFSSPRLHHTLGGRADGGVGQNERRVCYVPSTAQERSCHRGTQREPQEEHEPQAPGTPWLFLDCAQNLIGLYFVPLQMRLTPDFSGVPW